MNFDANQFIDAHNQNSFDNQKSNDNVFSEQIIYCAHARLNYMSPPLYSRRQIFVGPRDETNYVPGGHTGFVNTAFGKYSLAEYIEKFELPKPEFILVHADEIESNLPTDINNFNCKKIMVLGDTHQSEQGILKVLKYFKEHQFNYYLADCKKNHVHFFYEAAPERKFIYFPLFRNRFEAKKFNYAKKRAVSLIGQLKSTHPYRLSIAEKIKGCGLPVLISESLQEQAIHIYNSFLINVNVSLNNDFNMRFAEVISAGGFLLTDRISKFTGYDEVFKENEDFVFYDNEQDLIEKIKYYYSHPEKALKIAKSGWEKYVKNWSINIRREKFTHLIRFDASEGLPNYKDNRFLNIDNKKIPSNLNFRVQLYGFLQEINKKGFYVVGLPKDVHEIISHDVKDLCRLSFFIYDHITNLATDLSLAGMKNYPIILVARRDDLQSIARDHDTLNKIHSVIQL